MSTFIGMGATDKVASKTNDKELKELKSKIEELENNLAAVTSERDELKSKIEELENNGTEGEKETPEDDKKSKNKNE